MSCIGGKSDCTCGETIAPECWDYYHEQEARAMERQIFEETGEEVTAVLTDWTVLSETDDGGDAA